MDNEKNYRYSKAHKKAIMKYEATHLYRATVKFPKDMEQIIRDRADSVAGSVNAYLKMLVYNDLNGGVEVEEPTHEAFYDAP